MFKMKHCGTKKIETSRLILRKFITSDARFMYKNWASDIEVTKYLTWEVHKDEKESLKIIKEWQRLYEKPNYYHWVITLKDNREPVGAIGVNFFDEKISMAHIGYCLGKKFWHQGIMSEALQAVIDFLFLEVDVNRIESRFDPRNVNSGKVMEKCKMIYEGTHKEADFNNQGICDAAYYAILKSNR